MTKIEVKQDDLIKVDELAIENNVNIVVNGELEIHLIHSPDGYIVDFYKALAPEVESEEHDYDADFLDSITLWKDQLEPENI
jgi:hypothetical protein